MRLIKNIIYNFSDIFIALIIIALAGFLIWTRIDIIMAYPDSDNQNSKSVASVAETTESSISTDTETNRKENSEENVDQSSINKIPEVSSVEKIENEDGTSHKIVAIANGCTTDSVAALLKQNNVISDMSYFISQLRNKKLEGAIEPGYYNIPKGCSMDDLINILCKQNTENPVSNAEYNEVSIPNNSSTEVVAGLLKQAGIITETNDFTHQIKAMNLDGKIEAGVYKIPKNSSMEELIKILCKTN